MRWDVERAAIPDEPQAVSRGVRRLGVLAQELALTQTRQQA